MTLIKTITIALAVLANGIDMNVQKDDSKEAVELAVGDPAPDWTMTGSDGKEYKLSDYKGKKGVVVAWYPMALTGG